MFCAKTLPANPPKRLKLAVEKTNDGLQGVSSQSSAVEVTASPSSWPTIAQAPSPASAIEMAVTAPTSVAAIWRSSSRRNCISRTSSAI